MTRGPRTRSARRSLLAAVLFTASACTGADAEPTPTPSTTILEAAQARQDDGILFIGALIPVNDPTIGTNLDASFQRAVEMVNEAGGVLGRQVEILVSDEGSTPSSAAQATEVLIEAGADAIVGPTSSNTAIGALGEAVAAGLVTCSATATAISLDDFPDRNLFFRSIPTDSLQATAIAREATSRGAGRVVILHVDDAYGRPYADAVADVLDSQPSIQVAAVAVPFADDDLEDNLDEVAAARADTAIVLGDGDDIARFLEALSAREDIDPNLVLVNDAARAQSTRPVIAALDETFRKRIVGVAPQVVLRESANVDDDDPFAAQVTDCVNLIALAAEQGGSDSPETIASQMTSVSSGGEECRTFADCITRLDADEEIDYDGPTRITELARDGDPSRAFFDRFVFLADGSSDDSGNIAVAAT